MSKPSLAGSRSFGHGEHQALAVETAIATRSLPVGTSSFMTLSSIAAASVPIESGNISPQSLMAFRCLSSSWFRVDHKSRIGSVTKSHRRPADMPAALHNVRFEYRALSAQSGSSPSNPIQAKPRLDAGMVDVRGNGRLPEITNVSTHITKRVRLACIKGARLISRFAVPIDKTDRRLAGGTTEHGPES